MAWSCRVLLITGLLVFAVLPASADGQTQRIKLWNSHANLPMPEGFCILSDAEAVDRELLEITRQFNEGRNEVLAMFAACGELEMLRSSGKLPTNVGTFLALLSAGPKVLTITRARFIAVLADHIRANDPFVTAAEELKDRAARVGAALEQADMVGLGLLLQDEAAVYSGVVMPDRSEGAEPGARTIVVSGITLLHGHPVSLALSTAYRDANSLEPLLATQRRNLQNLVEVNRPAL